MKWLITYRYFLKSQNYVERVLITSIKVLLLLMDKYIHYSVSKKMVFCGKIAITTFKLIQNPKVGGVS